LYLQAKIKKNFWRSYLAINPVKNDSVLIGTGSGNLVELELP